MIPPRLEVGTAVDSKSTGWNATPLKPGSGGADLVIRRKMGSANVCACFILAVALLQGFPGAEADDGLSVGFYRSSCPVAEYIVAVTLAHEIEKDANVPAGILRLIFHDCFVRGCDASVLLDSVGSQLAEKEGRGVSLRGFEAIDRIKSALEKACPGIVSCADLLAFAARSSVAATGGPHWEVEAGRRDGTVSLADEAGPPNLPVAVFNTTANAQIFAGKGFTLDEMVTLSGSHSIGQARCNTFSNRLTGASPDPTLHPTYAATLKDICGPDPASANTTRADLDPVTPLQFDSSYYSNLAADKGLLTSDQDLFTDASTKQLVLDDANDQRLFFHKFAAAMIKLGKVQVLTGSQGQIRQNCRLVN